jgi:hypothetical protein
MNDLNSSTFLTDSAHSNNIVYKNSSVCHRSIKKPKLFLWQYALLKHYSEFAWKLNCVFSFFIYNKNNFLEEISDFTVGCYGTTPRTCRYYLKYMLN